jgi:spore coat polysaccharide biosynthesis predicted glycosyltransferase SpsG/L-amino acid N-acyltransferase YncA
MEPPVRSVLLTEDSHEIGSGHLSRCVALADALRHLGATCTLVVRGDAPSHLTAGHTCAVADWLQLPILDEQVSGADIVVVDSYVAPLEIYEHLAATVPVGVWFDDNARVVYPLGIVVNGSPAASSPSYAGGKKELLLGPTYQVLREPFWHVPARSTEPSIGRVLVVFGGSGARGLVRELTAVLAETLPEAFIDVVDAPRSALEMRDSMLAADIAISAAGQTLYELAATATPTIAVCVADNQVAQARALAAAGVIEFAGLRADSGIAQSVTMSVERVAAASVRERMSHAALSLIDGRGALRVARRAIARVLVSRIELRPAQASDELDLFELANDPVVRAVSFSPGPIAPDEHHRWFSARLEDPDTFLLLAWDASTPVGYVRFLIEAQSAEVSIALAEAYRGRGVGAPILMDGLSALRQYRPGIQAAVARVRSENEPSAHLFDSAGFVRQNDACAGTERALFRASW